MSLPELNALCHECLSQFDDWLEAEELRRREAWDRDTRMIAKAAFVAGFQGGGRHAVEIMHTETKRIFRP